MSKFLTERQRKELYFSRGNNLNKSPEVLEYLLGLFIYGRTDCDGFLLPQEEGIGHHSQSRKHTALQLSQKEKTECREVVTWPVEELGIPQRWRGSSKFSNCQEAAASSWAGERKRDVTSPWALGPSGGSSGERSPAYGHQVHERSCPMAWVPSCFSCVQFCVTLRSFRLIFFCHKGPLQD